jgi:hypothetical protein
MKSQSSGQGLELVSLEMALQAEIQAVNQGFPVHGIRDAGIVLRLVLIKLPYQTLTARLALDWLV